MSRRPNFPHIRGFERLPEGKLLSQRVDFDGPVGIAYERCVGYTKPAHTHDRITISFPRGSSRSFIRVFPEKKKFDLHADVAHIMAVDHSHEQGSRSSIYDTFALFVTEAHYEAHLQAAGFKAKDIRAFLKTTQKIRRSPALEDAVRRYFFCRVLEESPSEAELRHLEALILTEVFSLARQTAAERSPAPPREPAPHEPSEETALVRALEFIEAHLFEGLDVAALVRSSRVSQATLFRLFKKQLGASPLEYVRNRRLDEARALLKRGDYQVSDVGLLIGYDDLSTFSKAFKKRFGKSPSSLIP